MAHSHGRPTPTCARPSRQLLSNKKGWGWSWPQRAVVGSYCLIITLSMWAGQAYVRPHAVATTCFASIAFYIYAAATYLPPLPTAPSPEVSGSRYWPAFREAGAPIWELAISYLGLTVSLTLPGARTLPRTRTLTLTRTVSLTLTRSEPKP